MILHDATGKAEWLQRAKQAIHMLATWTVSYDYAFPKDSILGRMGVKATGAIFASSQNNHAAPGFYVMSGDFMLKYLRAAGHDPKMVELYRDWSHNVMQYMNTRYNLIQPDYPEGLVGERVQLSDWEGLNTQGNSIGSGEGGLETYCGDPETKEKGAGDSNMAWESLVELTALENPGIYLNTGTGDMVTLDHVAAKIVAKDDQGYVLELSNTTSCDAKVKIFAETADAAQTPFPAAACLHWPKVEVKAGETRRVRIAADGSLI
jgi:hypothetical protein